MTRDETDSIFGADKNASKPITLAQRRAFLKLPAEKRRQLLADQAKLLTGYYANEAEYLTSEDVVNDY